MDTTLTKDQRGFVEGVVSYLKKDSRSKSAVPKVQAFLGKVTAQAKKEKIAHVESSVSLTQDEENVIERILASHIGHQVRIESIVNTSTLGGFQIRVGDWIIDTTLNGQLRQMANLLVE
jgi:F-type H+-transporting ATPase subunit delta